MEFKKWNFFWGITLALGGSLARADEFHHRNILIGERAPGMGGAFTALSDDPSGIFYNPAGLAFVFENYISLSANAWSATNYTFNDVVPGQDYSLNSAALVPAFFGFTQSLGKLKMAFAIVVPNSDLVDQNDTLEGFNDSNPSETAQNYLTRRYYKTDNTYLIGPALAGELFDNFSVGLSLLGNFRIAKSIDNQLGSFKNERYFFRNQYVDIFSQQLTPKLGIQWMPISKMSFGFSASMDFSMGGTVSLRRLATAGLEGEDIPYVQQGGTFSTDIEDSGTLKGDYKAVNFAKASAGLGYFFSKRFLMSFDVDSVSPLNSDNHKTVLNYALGMEWYLTDGMPLRLGFMTNNSSASAAGVTGEGTSVNFYTATTGVSWVGGGSSFSLGLSYGVGSGQGRVTGSGYQNVDAKQYSIFLQGSYQL